MSPGKSVLALQPARTLWPALLLLCGALLYAAMATADINDEVDPSGRVARVNLLDGHGSLQLAGTDSWIDDLVNRPLTAGDKLWIEPGSRAEVHVGSTVLRLGASTALQFVIVDDRTVRLRLTAGSMSVRLRQLDNDEVFNIETPAGEVELLDAGGYRFDVADRDERARVAVWSGRARAQGAGGAQLLQANESAEMFGGDQPGMEMASAGSTDSLDLWAESRDRREDESRSARYVSRDVVGYEELDGYGDWVVDPIYGSVWVPQQVASDWAPFRFGYWSWIGPWGWTWIDDAPWGFAPCHYGRWVHRDEGWGWVPGPVRGHRSVFAPALVAWVGGRPERYADGRHAPRVGWVPLGYNEVYRPPFHASRNYLQNANASNTHLDRGALAHALDHERDEDTHDGQRGPRRYAHQDVPGAVTTVSRDTFVSARPVGRNRLKVDGNELRDAAVHTGAIDIRPDAHSFGREVPHDRPVPRPDRAIFDRPVVSAGPGAPANQTPAGSGTPMQQRRLEALQPPAHPADRPAQVVAPPQAVAPLQNPPPRREPVREYRDSRPPLREAPQARELPPPPPRPNPPSYAPPPRPVMVSPPLPPPPPPSAVPQKPAPVAHAEHSERVERVDHSDRSHDHNRN